MSPFGGRIQGLRLERMHASPRFVDGAFMNTRPVAPGLKKGTALPTMTGPLVKPAADKLLRALTQLDKGESWLVEPRRLDGAGNLWAPGVKLGVRPGSFFHLTECFGPVLGIMRARDLDDALALQNAPEFGLTGGLHSLDPDEIAHWRDRVEVGNVYVNRHTTGAIVRRQPFGGWKHSAVGPGAKTGGPHDVLRFVRYEGCTADPAGSYEQWWQSRFRDPHDDSGLRAERNELRHRALPKVLVCGDAPQVDLVTAAARLTGTPFEVVAADDQLAARVARSGATRLRTFAPVAGAVARACHAANIVIDDTPATGHGLVELARWTREQAISTTLHRHGRVPEAG